MVSSFGISSCTSSCADSLSAFPLISIACALPARVPVLCTSSCNISSVLLLPSVPASRADAFARFLAFSFTLSFLRLSRCICTTPEPDTGTDSSFSSCSVLSSFSAFSSFVSFVSSFLITLSLRPVRSF